MRLVDNKVASLTREERATKVGIPLREIFRDSIDHPLRDLGASGRVEENCRLTVDGLSQRRKLLPDPLNVEFTNLGGDVCAC